jgi:hypothetical protein
MHSEPSGCRQSGNFCCVPSSRSKRSTQVGAGAILAIGLVIAGLAISSTVRRITPSLQGSGCLVRGHSYDVPLTTGQAGLAATIAGVARRRSMPVRAVTIAYATALQESDLENLHFGDRDSVGVFQQRPSQGWGTRQQLLDPVYASSRFFGALAGVTHYRHLLIYQAAQAVQRSADGYAYSQYAPQGAQMASGFSGRQAHAVWCWYGSGLRGRVRLAAASRALARTFGQLPVSRISDPMMVVQVSHPLAGWAVAAWLVTHAASYRIREVRYLGYQWTAAHGVKGWTR